MKRQFIFLLTLFIVQFAVAQSIEVTGTVTDAGDNNSALPGVVIQVKGTTNGTLTDIDGNFAITANQGDILVFSMPGYKDVERKVTSARINVALTTDADILNEVVAVGYGTMKKKDITGAIASVKAEDLKKTPAANFDQALAGRAVGVVVNANSGRPGAAAEIRIRGVGTLNNPTPIYVVDGVMVEDISFLSPNDIESMEILKDASASAIYGSKGANGVILVSTKKGEAGKMNIYINASLSIQNRYKKLKLLGKQDFLYTMLTMDGIAASERNDFKNNGFMAWLRGYRLSPPATYYPFGPFADFYETQETDWQDAIFVKNALIHNYNIGIDGGTDKFLYSLSGNYFDQTGIIIGSFYKRFTVRLNTSYQPYKWLKIGENLSFTHSRARSFLQDNHASSAASIISGALAMAPWDPTHYPEGTYNYLGQDISGNPAAASNKKTEVRNPFTLLKYNHPLGYGDRWFGDLYLDIMPVKGLTLRSDFAFDFTTRDDRSFTEAYNISAAEQYPINSVSHSQSRTLNIIFANTATYAREIGKHNFSIMVGHTLEQWRYDAVSASGQNILNPIERNWFVSQATEYLNNPSDGVGRGRRLSYIARGFYSFDDRYIINVTFRADGSSKFRTHPWGYFPSVGLAWRVSEEKFMKNVKNLDNLKLRLGWGRIGNDRAAGDNASFTQVGSGSYSFYAYPFGTRITDYNSLPIPDQIINNGAAILTMGNPALIWETTEQYNLGIDFSIFKGKLSGTLDLFQRNTLDMIMWVPAPAQAGVMWDGTQNIGLVTNKGIELSLEHRNKVRDFTYSIGGNISYVKNKLVKRNGGNPITDQYSWTDEGLPLGSFYGLTYLGVYSTQREADEYLYGYAVKGQPNQYNAGDAKFEDLNGDGIIDDQDRKFLGSPIPTINYGLNISMEWKGIDLQIFFQGVAGNKVYNQMRTGLEGSGMGSALSVDMLDVYKSATLPDRTTPNPDANINGSIPNPYGSNNFQVSSRFLESGAYLRLKNLQLGYTVPAKLLKKAHITRMRFFVQGSNIFTITKYRGFDPEVGMRGVDYGNYPQFRTFTFGMNLNF